MKTETENIVLPKGEQIKFLDYIIQNSLNNDGLVLIGNNENWNTKSIVYGGHLGNYGTGTQSSVNMAKKFALIHFMLMRPEKFDMALMRRINKPGSGSHHEYFALSRVLKKEGLEMPEEITHSRDGNYSIMFLDKKL